MTNSIAITLCKYYCGEFILLIEIRIASDWWAEVVCVGYICVNLFRIKCIL